MSEVAQAYVSLLPSAKNWGKQVEGQIGPGLDSAGKSGGRRLSGALGGVLKKSVIGIGGAAGAGLGVALFKGFNRLSAIDEAQAKLKGLGNSTKTVDAIMTNALASVKGTAFGLGDAATVAAGAVASGVKPGKDLTRNLKLVADAATIAGVPLNEMGAIFNKVAASGKIQGDVIAQLGDQGIPILQLLGKEIGKTPAEVSKLASQGKIDFKTFQAAMENGLGGAALKSGNTFKGALANVGAAMGRLGAGLLKGLFPIAKQVFGGITSRLDTLTAKVGPVADAFSARLPGAIKAVVAAFQRLKSGGGSAVMSRYIDILKGFVGSVIRAGKTAAPAIASIVRGLAPLAKLAAGGAIVVLTAAMRALGPTIEAVASAFANTVNFVKSNQTTFKVLAAVIGAALVPVLIEMGVVLVTNAVSVAALGAAMVLYNTVTKVMAVGTKILSASQWLLNAALAANPIGLVIIGLVALGAAFVVLWKKSDTFRAIVMGAFNGVKTAAMFVFNWIKSHWPLLLAIITGPIGLAVYAVVKNWSRIKSATSAAFNAVRNAVSGAMSSVKNSVSNGVSSVVNFIKGLPGKIRGLASSFLSAGKHLGSRIISGLGEGLRSAGGFVGDLAGSIKRAVNSALHLPVRIHGPGPLPDFKIPAFARGGRTPGGPILAGENGAELIDVPRNSQVYTASQTRTILGGSGSGIGASGTTDFATKDDIAQVVDAILAINLQFNNREVAKMVSHVNQRGPRA